MKKKATYGRTRFSADAMEEALETFRSQLPEDTILGYLRTVHVKEAEWTHNSDEEFFADYRQRFVRAYYVAESGEYYFLLHAYGLNTIVEIGAPERRQIEKTFGIFEKHRGEATIPEPPKPEPPPPAPPTVFIGHGQSRQWRDLKDHLQDQHGYAVEAYEVGARAGHAIRDILQGMLTKSSFAVLVMTGEDETAEGGVRARQNVVHEIGLFQGKLGFNRAIVLVEEGVEVFSNLQGIDQIRYAKGNIRETYGEVLATLRREFG